MTPELIVVLLFSVLAILVFGTVVLPRMRESSPDSSAHLSTSGGMEEPCPAQDRERACDEARLEATFTGRPSTFR